MIHISAEEIEAVKEALDELSAATGLTDDYELIKFMLMKLLMILELNG